MIKLKIRMNTYHDNYHVIQNKNQVKNGFDPFSSPIVVSGP